MSKKLERSEGGSDIYKYSNEDRKHNMFEVKQGDENHILKLEKHINDTFGKVDMVWHEIVSDLIHIDLHHIKPTKERNFHTFVTTGMSFIPMNTPENYSNLRYAELILCLPSNWKVSEEDFKEEENYWPLALLKYLARFPHEYNTWLGWGHTIPNGNPSSPYASNTKLTGSVVLNPLTISKEGSSLEIEDKYINFYSVIPLYEEEMDFKLKFGIDLLLDKLDEIKISELLEINRINTCADFK